MRRSVLVLICLAIVLIGCSSGTAEEDENTVWTEVTRWEGDTVKITEAFEIDSPSWRITWDTHSYAEGQKRFRVRVLDASEMGGSEIAEAVNTDGPDQGSLIIRRTGIFFLQIDARQPYTIIVEIPE
jgi:ABC-type glycerol-3-phosphate transport system substrate-binding protein